MWHHFSCGTLSSCHPIVERQLMWVDDEYASHTNSNIMCTSNKKQICYIIGVKRNPNDAVPFKWL